MKLHKIKLENIRSYVSEEVIFPEGKVLLWGNIGSGKSSILYAIDFVLFGLQRSELAGASLLRNGVDEGSVELTFSLEDKEFILKRALKRTKNGVVQDAGSIVRDGVKQDKTAIELKQIVLELLHYPKDLLTKNKTLIYRYTVYTPQEEMKTILLGPKEERLDTLRKVFGVDKYKRVKENSKIIISELKDRKKVYEGATVDLGEKILEKERKEQEKKDIERSIEMLFPTLEDVKKRASEKTEQIALLEKKKEELSSVQKELAVLNLEERTKKEELERGKAKKVLLQEEILHLEQENLPLLLDVKEKMVAIDTTVTLKEKEAKDVTITFQELKFKKEDIERNVPKEKTLQEEVLLLEKEALITPDNAKEKIISLDSTIILKEKELRSVLNSYQELKTKKEHALYIKMKIESLNNCPTCFQQVSLEYKQKIFENTLSESELFAQKMQEAQLQQERLEKEIENDRKELEGLRKQESERALVELKRQNLQKKKAELEILVREHSILETITQKMQEIELQQVTLEKEIEKSRKELEALRKQDSERALVELKKQNLQRKKLELGLFLQREEELSLELQKLSARLFDLTENQKRLSSLEELYAPLKQEVEQLQIRLQHIQLEKMQAEVNLKHILASILTLTGEIQKKTELREKKEHLNSVQFWLTDSFIPLMDTMEKNILFKVHEEFTSLFEKWFAILIDNQSLVMSLDEEYSPKITQNGYDIEYEFLSGGEKTAGALAYRLALNQVINRLNVGLKTQDLLILDEPTDGFSSEQLDRLKILMDEIQIPQIILVSHEAQIECFADHIIRFEKRDHITKVISQ